MAEINIVLVEPQIPQNTGNIARTAAATGCKLHLVRPFGFEITDARVKRAGLDYWHLVDICYYDNLDDFFRRTSGEYYYFTTKADKAHSGADYTGSEIYLLFGREDAGLPEELIASNKDSCVRIPMKKESRSLNLSNSVAVAVYEALRQRGYSGLQGEGEGVSGEED